jgi:hypothetical protein
MQSIKRRLERLSAAPCVFALALFIVSLSSAHAQAMEDHAAMQGVFGPYGMTREASGTSWQPDSSAMEGIHSMSGSWMTMWHGSLTGVYTDQHGPRGDSQAFTESMLMFMARRQVSEGVIGLRAMMSLEPTMGSRGYPLLFQTGETANGRDPLIDRQHPHNLLMEVAASYSRTLARDSSIFIYAGPVGEPALGPPAFMHRASSDDNPEAPLTHHWLDATHVAFGVVTIGYVWRDFKVEASAFNGREPDEHRYDVQFRSLDSSSIRLSWNPTSHLAMQISSGRLSSPEQLEPEINVRRTTASAIYDQPFDSVHWQTTLAAGRDAADHGHHSTDGYLLDSALRLPFGHTVFARFEYVEKNELFESGTSHVGEVFPIRKLSAGYSYDFAQITHLSFGIGGVISKHFIPDELNPVYGRDPSSLSLFLRARLMP